MKVERARRRDFDELMDLMVRCFRTNHPFHLRFEDLYPDLYRPTETCAACHRILRRGGRIAAAVGVYPLDLQVGPARLRVAGIGAVCTDPRWRGRGFMTVLMEAVRRDLHAEGYGSSWLSGDRQRYAHYGWEVAGTGVELHVRRPADLGPAAARWTARRVEDGEPAPPGVFAARGAAAAFGRCSEREWARRLRRPGHGWAFARSGGRHAFAVWNRTARTVAEWGGPAAGVAAALGALLEPGEEGHVRLPALEDEVSALFWSWAHGAHSARLWNLSVVEPLVLLREYGPWLRDRWPRGRTLELRMREGRRVHAAAVGPDGRAGVAGGARADVTVELDPLRLTSFVFGPGHASAVARRPAADGWVDGVFPLPFHVPPLFAV